MRNSFTFKVGKIWLFCVFSNFHLKTESIRCISYFPQDDRCPSVLAAPCPGLTAILAPQLLEALFSSLLRTPSVRPGDAATHTPSQDAAPDPQPPLRAPSWPYNPTYLFVPKPLPHTLDCYHYLLTSVQNIFPFHGCIPITSHSLAKTNTLLWPGILAGHCSRDSLPRPGFLGYWEEDSRVGRWNHRKAPRP